MQEVSEKWKSAHKQTLLNEGFVEVSLDIADPDSLADIKEVQDNGAIYISNSSELTNGVEKSPTPYCTLEQNLWVLDGTRKHIPESATRSEGFVSDVMSDDACAFTDKIPTLTIDFSKEFTSIIPGVTITWSEVYNEFATDFLVRAFNGDMVVAEREVLGNRSVTSAVLLDISGYDRIVVYVKKWCLPNRRARVNEIFVGVKKVYTKSDLFDYSHKQSVSPLSFALPKNEIKYSVGNVNGEFNPYNNSGLSKYLKERQEVKTRYGLKLNDGTIEWIKGGTFYLSEWSAKQNGLTAEFGARDLLTFMGNIYEDKHDLSQRSLYDLAEMVLTKANLPLNRDGSVKWRIDESLREIYTNAPLPKDSLANCLQLIANAGRCDLYQDRDGILCIEKHELGQEATDYSITPVNSYSKPEVTIVTPIGEVDVMQYTYTNGDKGIESTTDLVGMGMGYNKGEGKLELDNPLITTERLAIDLGAYTLYNYAERRMTLDFSWRPDLRLDALDVITTENDYNTQQVRITDVEYKFNGAFRATGKGEVISNG